MLNETQIVIHRRIIIIAYVGVKVLVYHRSFPEKSQLLANIIQKLT